MTTQIEQLVAAKRKDIGSLCAGLFVHELRVFGSAVTKQAMKNPVFRHIVETTSELLYAA